MSNVTAMLPSALWHWYLKFNDGDPNKNSTSMQNGGR